MPNLRRTIKCHLSSHYNRRIENAKSKLKVLNIRTVLPEDEFSEFSEYLAENPIRINSEKYYITKSKKAKASSGKLSSKKNNKNLHLFLQLQPKLLII